MSAGNAGIIEWRLRALMTLFPTPAFGVHFGMGRAHFEQILAALSFRPADDGTDPWPPAIARVLINIHLCICLTPRRYLERRRMYTV